MKSFASKINVDQQYNYN